MNPGVLESVAIGQRSDVEVAPMGYANLTLTAEIRKKACNLFRSKLLLLHENNRNMVG
jgi:hypothetical protein